MSSQKKIDWSDSTLSVRSLEVLEDLTGQTADLIVTEAASISGSVSELFGQVTQRARVFYEEPTGPYTIGDLWVNNGVIYQANASRDLGFLVSEWDFVEMSAMGYDKIVARYDDLSLPSIPDDTTGYKYRNKHGWPDDESWAGGTGVTVSVDSVGLKCVFVGGDSDGTEISKSISGIATNDNLRLRIVSTVAIANISYYAGGEVETLETPSLAISPYEWIIDISITYTSGDLYLYVNNGDSAANTVWFKDIYIGDGNYKTLPPDTTGNEHGLTTLQSAIPTPGIHGKMLLFNGMAGGGWRSNDFIRDEESFFAGARFNYDMTTSPNVIITIGEIAFGDFSGLSQTSRSWWNGCVAPNGDVYACVYGGDIYKQTGGAGNFVALGGSSRLWQGMAAAANGDIYATVEGGDIYKQTGGTGSFVGLGGTSRNWWGICVAPNGDIYASVYGGDIYKQTGGVGAFSAQSQTVRGWTSMCADASGNIYACAIMTMWGIAGIYKQAGGTGDFVTTGAGIEHWTGITVSSNGDIYACVSNGDIYKQTGGTGSFVGLGQTSRLWYGLAGDLDGDIYAFVVSGDIYKRVSYIACVESDIGKNVVCTGKAGTLLGYDNDTKTWNVFSTDTFAADDELSITDGTGGGIVESVSYSSEQGTIAYTDTESLIVNINSYGQLVLTAHAPGEYTISTTLGTRYDDGEEHTTIFGAYESGGLYYIYLYADGVLVDESETASPVVWDAAYCGFGGEATGGTYLLQGAIGDVIFGIGEIDIALAVAYHLGRIPSKQDMIAALKIDNIAADNLVTQSEKLETARQWQSIYNDDEATTALPEAPTEDGEFTEAYTAADAIGIWTPTTPATNAYIYYEAAEALRAYLFDDPAVLLLSTWEANIDITRSTFKGLFTDYHAAYDALWHEIEQYHIVAAASDAKIDKIEKLTIRKGWCDIYNDTAATSTLTTTVASMADGEYKALATAATSYGCWTPTEADTAAKTLYDAAEALRSYLFTTPAVLLIATWDDVIDITASTWRTLWTTYRSSADALWNEIADYQNGLMPSKYGLAMSFSRCDLTGEPTPRILDNSGAGNHGTIYGGATVSLGEKGVQVALDGVNDYIKASYPNASEYTVLCWYKGTFADSDASASMINLLRQSAGTRIKMLPYGGKLRLRMIDSSGGTGNYITSDTSINDDLWHFCAFAYRAGDTRLYVDAVEEGTRLDKTFSALYYNDVRIGKTASYVGMTGIIAEPRIYTRFFSQQEIRGAMLGQWPEDIAYQMADWLIDPENTGNNIVTYTPRYLGSLTADPVAGMHEGDYYLHNDASPRVIRRYNSGAWADVSGSDPDYGKYVSAALPDLSALDLVAGDAGISFFTNLVAKNIFSQVITLLTDGKIKSSDFETGVSGFSLNDDGTAEFQDVTVRGEFTGNVNLQQLKITELTAGNYFLYAPDPTGSSTSSEYAKACEAELPCSGTIRVKFTASAGGGEEAAGLAKIYVNGVAVGTERAFSYEGGAQTYSEDISDIEEDDKIQIYALVVGGGGYTAYITDFGIYVGEDPGLLKYILA